MAANRWFKFGDYLYKYGQAPKPLTAVTPVGVAGTWSLIFQDEFSGTSLDTAKWSPTWWEGATQNDVPTSAANVSVSGGYLRLRLASSTSGAAINTNPTDKWNQPTKVGFQFVNGYAEARIWFPGPGTTPTNVVYNWPAWWTNGQTWPNDGEIDIAEPAGWPNPNTPANIMTANYHYGPDGIRRSYGTGAIAGNWANSWHVYGVNRLPDRQDYYYDGVLVASHPRHETSPHYLLLNVGKSPNATAYGAASEMMVDYVRVWQAGTTPDNGGGGTAPAAALTTGIVGPTDISTALTTNAVSVRLKTGSDALVTQDIVYSSAATPDAQGWSRVPAATRAAGSTYYAKFAMKNSDGVETESAVHGPYRVAPTTATNFGIVFGSCHDGDPAVFSTMANRNDNLFFHLGDMWYDDGASNSLDSFRSHMQGKLVGTNLKKLLQKSKLIYTASDHDFGMNNNVTGATSTTARDNWNAVSRQMIPQPFPGSLGAYYTFVWGRVRFIVWDLRTFKSNPANADNTSKTAMGQTQKDWFKNILSTSTEPMVVAISETPWKTGADATDDGWAGYMTELDDLGTYINNWRANTSKKMIVLFGDAHMIAADNGTSSPGGCPVFAGSPFNKATSFKGGPSYSGGTYPTSFGAFANQYGRIAFTDDGTTISATFNGYTADNVARITPMTITASGTGGGGGGGTPTPPAPGTITKQGDARVTELGTGGGTIAANMPTGVVADECLIAVVATSVGSTPPTPTGWTQIPNANPTETSGPISQTGYYRIATASEPATYTWSGVGTGRSSVIIQRFSGVSKTAPIDVTASNISTQTDANTTDTVALSLAIPSITTATANAMIITACTANTSTSSTLTVPTGTTLAGITQGPGRREALAYEVKATAGSTGTRTWNLTGTVTLQMAGWMTALRPA